MHDRFSSILELRPAGWTILLACLAYSFCSISMTFSSKVILSQYDFNYPILLLLWQNVFAIVVVRIASLFNYVQVEPLVWGKVRRWLPLNVLFVLTLVTSLPSIRLLSVAMVTILKNFQTIGVTVGDKLFFGQDVTGWTAISILLMFVGSVVAGANDLQFNLLGYVYMGINCAFGASYALYMRELNTVLNNNISKVYYNNVLSVPFLLLLSLFMGDFYSGVQALIDMSTPTFVAVIFYNGMCGMFISATSFWVIKVTSPTTYSIVGALNKIPLAILGIIWFKTQMALLGMISIAVGLGGGVIYAWSKKYVLSDKKDDEESMLGLDNQHPKSKKSKSSD